MKIGETYWHTSPNGDKEMVTLYLYDDKEKHEALEKEGHTYILQPVSTTGTCLSCEGWCIIKTALEPSSACTDERWHDNVWKHYQQ